MLTRLACLSLAAATLALAAPSAHAFTRNAASVCTPVAGSPAMFGKVHFNGAGTGTIRVSCPLDVQSIQAGDRTYILYRDSTGASTAAHVKSFLAGNSVVDGSRVITPLFNSNSSALTQVTGGYGPNMSGSLSVYGLWSPEVELKRTSSAQTVEFYGYYVGP